MSTTENAEPTTTYEQAREELAKLCQHWLDRARERLAAAAPADQPE